MIQHSIDKNQLERLLRLIKEALINWLRERITSLRGTRAIAYLVDMSRLLCSVRLVLHFTRRINQRFPKNRSAQR